MNAAPNSAGIGDSGSPPPAAAGCALAIRLAVIEQIAAQFALGSLAESIDVARRLLARPPAVAIAVLGGFKAGKSSFINCLAEAPLLPVAAIPATAILTRVAGGAPARAGVTLASGERVEIPVGELAEWVTEDRNPLNTRRVSLVEVEAPGLARFPGLVFIDTPGIGSVFAHNSGTSLGYLPRIEAAVLAIPCTAPLSEGDIALLRRIADLSPRFAVLLTKADLCSSEQRQEVHRFVVTQLRRASLAASVHFWSQRPEFQAERDEFIRAFLHPLDSRAAEASAEIAAHRVRLLAIETKGLLQAALAAATRDSGVRRELRTRLDSLCDGPVGVPALLGRLEREAGELALPHALAVLEPLIAPLAARLREGLEVQVARWHGTLARAGNDYEKWMQAELAPRLIEVSQSQQARLAEPLIAFADNCEKLVADFHARLTDAVREVLGVTLTPPPWQASLAPPRQPDIAVSAAFMFRLDWLWAVLPVSLVRPWLRRHLARRVGWEAEKNLSRLAAQWERELRREIASLARAARGHLALQRETLQRLLEPGPDARLPIAEALARLEAGVLPGSHARADDCADDSPPS